MASIATYHETYSANKPLVDQVKDCIKGQHHIRKMGDKYLPKTGIMATTKGEKLYTAYAQQARFTNLVQDTEGGIIGLAFKDEPQTNNPFDVVTNNGRDAKALSLSQLREVLEAGRSVMLVDAPHKGSRDWIAGKRAYITEYPSEQLIDWAVDDVDDSRLVAVKFCETYFEEGDIYKTEALTRYRQYKIEEGRVNIYLQDEDGTMLADMFTIPIDYIPVFTAGSVDNLPTIDPIPLLPVSDCAIAMYQISARYRQWLDNSGQGTIVITGASMEDCQAAFDQGTGTGAAWAIQGENVEAKMLESSAGTSANFTDAIEMERLIAEQYMVAITSQGSGIEAAESLKLRAATKHATVHGILSSISEAMRAALQCVADWNGVNTVIEYKILTDFTAQEASSQMITALNASIAMNHLPKSVVQDYVINHKITELTKDQMNGEIEDAGGAG